MDYSSDENHNRSVFTIVGDPDQMGEAAFRFAKACVEKIDMTKHHGEHPRMGAVDVTPSPRSRMSAWRSASSCPKRSASASGRS